jgi:hypothetical protein
MAEYKIPVPSTRDAALFSILVMTGAFRTTLEKIAAEHGFQAGPWFDDLVGQLVTDARGTISDMPESIEAEGVGVGLQTLEAVIQTVRNKLT